MPIFSAIRYLLVFDLVLTLFVDFRIGVCLTCGQSSRVDPFRRCTRGLSARRIELRVEVERLCAQFEGCQPVRAAAKSTHPVAARSDEGKNDDAGAPVVAIEEADVSRAVCL